MKFPHAVFRSLPPRREDHDFVWQIVNVILPDGKVVNGLMDFDDDEWCLFEYDGIWRRALAKPFLRGREEQEVIDLRDAYLLSECEDAISAYEAMLPGPKGFVDGPIHSAADQKVDLFKQLRYVEELADQSGFNDHNRIARLHDKAWKASR